MAVRRPASFSCQLDIPTLAGAGARYGVHCVNDMLTFVAANLGFSKTPLAAAMAAMLNARVFVRPA